ncbi:MAG: hypothetical protein BEN19_08680 [Epulopiscium sp. Nuni2H_MBin003]|nr:MAG: hypothetical protein BEN19_08680 [Epulopiscium sp. Nuni2H_MBin003]
MKKIFLLTICISLLSLTGCSKSARDVGNTQEMINGQVVEIEGPQDQYGYFPHMRLTFNDDQIQEVYFDYISDTAEKKSQDEEYNSTMQEKTGTSTELAMIDLRQQLLNKQDVEEIRIIAGATQTSKEFIEMAAKAIKSYEDGKTSANNYGAGNEALDAVNRGRGLQTTSTQSDEQSTYFNGGDGNSSSASSTSSES